MKKVFWIAFLTAFILLCCFFALNSYLYIEKQAEVQTELRSFTFICPSNDTIEVTYGRGESAVTVVTGGEDYLLARTVSASGARYTNADESVIFWEHQREATVEIDGEVVYERCVLGE